MKFVCRAMGVLALLIAAAIPAQSQAIKIYPSGSAIAAGQFVSEDSGGRVNPIPANSTSGVIGVAQNGAPGVGLPVTVQLYGPIQANMDGSCAVDQIVVISSTLNGAGHCQNSFPSAQVLGLSEQNFAATSPLGSLVSILISPLTATAQAGTGGTGSSIFASFQFGSATAITGTGNYIQLTTNAGSSNVLALSQTGAGTALSPYVGLFTLNVQGTDTKLLSSGTISGAAGTLLCLDANSGATTTSCNSGVGLTSVGLVITPGWLTVAGSPLTSNGSFTVTATGGQTSHQVIGTCGTAAQFGPCSLVAGDLPSSITSNTSGNAATATALATLPTPCSSGNAPTGILANGNSTGCAPIGGTPAFPVTVTGGVSGAIPYFSSTTIEGASALLAQYGVMIGGGAGQPPSTIAATTNTSYALFGTAGAPAFRAIANSDLPGTLTANTSGNAATATQLAGTPSTCGAGVAATGITASGAAAGCFTPGGLANPMTTLGDSIYGGAGGAAQRLAGPTSPAGVPQIYGETPSGGVAGAPAWRTAGVTTRVIGGSTASDTILATDCTNREAYLGSAAVALTLPTATSLGVSQCILKIGNYTTGAGTAVTITPTTWTIGPFAAASFQVPQNQWCVLTVDGTNWDTDCGSTTTPNYFKAGDFPGATLDVQINACDAAALAVHGTCDWRTLPTTGFIAASIPVGDVGGDALTVLAPPYMQWISSITDGVSCAVVQYSKANILGTAPAYSTNATIKTQSTTNEGALYCTGTTSTNLGYLDMSGIDFKSSAAGAVNTLGAAAIIDYVYEGAFDQIQVFDDLDTCGIIIGPGIGGADWFGYLGAEGNFGSGVTPLCVKGQTGGYGADQVQVLNLDHPSINHPGAGFHNMTIVDGVGSAQYQTNTIVNIYGGRFEMNNSDTTTSAIYATNAKQLGLFGVECALYTGPSTAACVEYTYSAGKQTSIAGGVVSFNNCGGCASPTSPMTMIEDDVAGTTVPGDPLGYGTPGWLAAYCSPNCWGNTYNAAGAFKAQTGTTGDYAQWLGVVSGGSPAGDFDVFTTSTNTAGYYSFFARSNLGTAYGYLNLYPGQGLTNTAFQMHVQDNSGTGAGEPVVYFDPLPVAGQSAQINMFRLTNTTAAVGLALFEGNGTSGEQSYLSANGNSYLNAQTGSVTFGSPTACTSGLVWCVGGSGGLVGADTAGDFYTQTLARNGSSASQITLDTSGNYNFGLLSFITGISNSPKLTIDGSYENASTPTYAEDTWGLQNLIGTGLNGTSTLTVTHSGSSGTASLSIPFFVGFGGNASISAGGSVTAGLTYTIEHNRSKIDSFQDGFVNFTNNAASANAILISGNKTFVTTDFTDSTSTTLTLVTGLSYTLPTSNAANLSFHCSLNFDQGTAAVSDSIGVGVTGTAPTNLSANAVVYPSASTLTAGTLTALASTTPTAIVTFTPSAITTVWNATIDGTIEQPSNATPGVLGIYVATSTGTDNLIVKRGSYCSVY